MPQDVTTQVNLDYLMDGQQADAADVRTPLQDLIVVINNMLNGVQARDTSLFAELSATPSTPTINKHKLYFKSDGKLYLLDNSGLEIELGGAAFDVIGKAGELLSARDVVYLAADDKWYKVDIDDVPPKISLVLGVVTSTTIVQDTTGVIRRSGIVSGYAGLNEWEPVYVGSSPASVHLPGEYTQTRPSPSGSNQIAQVQIGIAVDVDKVFVDCLRIPILFMKRNTSLANSTGMITITHIEDLAARRRELRAILNSSIGGLSIANYGTLPTPTEADRDVKLRERQVATYTADQTSPAGTATASTTLAGKTPIDAFDNSTDYATEVWITNSVNTGWLQYDFGAGNEKTIRRYRIQPQSNALARAPKTWTLKGSNDGTNFDTLDTQTNITGWVASTWKEFSIYNATAYRYYRIDVTLNSGDATYLCIAEMELLEASTFTTTKDKLSQSFQATGSQTVDKVKLWLKKTGSPTGTLTLRVETNNAGSPSGTLVDSAATVTVAESSLSTSYGWIEFNFASNFTLSGSTTYWLVLSTDRDTPATNIESNYVSWGADVTSPGYANGEMKSAPWTVETKDAGFQVINISAATVAENASANVNTDVLLKGVAYGTDQCTGGSAAASSNETGFTPNLAFDDNNSTNWFPAVGTGPSYIQYTFTSAKSIHRYSIRSRSDLTGFESASPKNFTLEYWDGAAWVVVDTQTNIGPWTAGQTRTFDVQPHTGSSTIWLIRITANNGSASYMGQASEIQMMEYSTTPKDRLAQSFQVTSTGTIDLVNLWLKKVGSPVGTMTLRIETDASGVPSGELVDAAATVTVAENTLSTSYAWVAFNFVSNFTLNTGMTYWLVLTTDRANSDTNYVALGADNSPAYSSGEMLSLTWSAEIKDAIFDAVAVGTAYDAPLRASSWGAGSGEVEFVHADENLANQDICSTVKNTTGAVADITFVVELK